MTIQLPIQKILKDGTAVEVDEMRPQEQEAVRALLNHFIVEGTTYPHAQPLSPEEFVAYWMIRDAFVVRTVQRSPEDALSPPSSEILGAFYLKPNFPGRSSHICNAGFIVQPTSRGQGIGRVMAEAMLAIAPSRGYAAVMFNLVYETNTPSLNLWKSLGFTILGRIPKAGHLANGETVDAYMLYYSFEPRFKN